MRAYLLSAVELRLELLHLMPVPLCKYFQLLLQTFHSLLQKLLLLLQASSSSQQRDCFCFCQLMQL